MGGGRDWEWTDRCPKCRFKQEGGRWLLRRPHQQWAKNQAEIPGAAGILCLETLDAHAQ